MYSENEILISHRKFLEKPLRRGDTPLMLSTEESNPASHFRLLDLPPEIRHMVFLYCISRPHASYREYDPSIRPPQYAGEPCNYSARRLRTWMEPQRSVFREERQHSHLVRETAAVLSMVNKQVRRQWIDVLKERIRELEMGIVLKKKREGPCYLKGEFEYFLALEYVLRKGLPRETSED